MRLQTGPRQLQRASVLQAKQSPGNGKNYDCHCEIYFKELVESIISHNHTLQWVNKQREMKKILDRGGRSGVLDHDRKKLLDSIGFEWNLLRKGEAAWHSSFEDLRKYIDKHGNADVPTKYKPNSLGRWVSTQRQQYKYFMAGLKTTMTQERVDRLNRVRFRWNALGTSSAETSPSAASSGSQATEPTRQNRGEEADEDQTESEDDDEEEQEEVAGDNEADGEAD